MARTAVIAGATGLVGRELVLRLTEEPEYSRIIALVRRPTGVAHPKVDDRQVNFDHLEADEFYRDADVFCSLGTTIRTAGSQEAFRAVDLGYPAALARLAAAEGARQFVVVSSVGANASASNFYLKTKGEMEREVSAPPFHAVHIFRPSFLTGERQEYRAGERIAGGLMKPLAFTLIGPFRKYRPVGAAQVASAMVQAAVRAEPGVHIYHYDEIVRQSQPLTAAAR